MDRKHIEYLTPELLYSEEPIWVNPVGGLGDIIMLSTALKRSFDKYSKKFCIARRTQYTEFFYESSCYSRNRSSCCWKLCCV